MIQRTFPSRRSSTTGTYEYVFISQYFICRRAPLSTAPSALFRTFMLSRPTLPFMELRDKEDEQGSLEEDGSSSIERALSDREIVQSAFPDETTIDGPLVASFPLHLRLYLSKEHSPAYIILEWNEGYPVKSPLQVSSFRATDDYKRLERTVRVVQATASQMHLEGGTEAGLACCAAALEAWSQGDGENRELQQSADLLDTIQLPSSQTDEGNGLLYEWTTGTTTVNDRKSLFVGHVCPVQAESDVLPALRQLLSSSSKMQRATHHMVGLHYFLPSLPKIQLIDYRPSSMPIGSLRNESF
jgi:Uncharacterized protein family UPF0029